MMADYNGWADQREEERELLDQLATPSARVGPTAAFRPVIAVSRFRDVRGCAGLCRVLRLCVAEEVGCTAPGSKVSGCSIASARDIRPFVWTRDGGMRSLPTLGGSEGRPEYLNEFGAVAGQFTKADGSARAAL